MKTIKRNEAPDVVRLQLDAATAKAMELLRVAKKALLGARVLHVVLEKNKLDAGAGVAEELIEDLQAVILKAEGGAS